MSVEQEVGNFIQNSVYSYFIAFSTPKYVKRHVALFPSSQWLILLANPLLYPILILPSFLFRRQMQYIIKLQFIGGFEPQAYIPKIKTDNL